MARYNAWQNESVYSAASKLDDAERKLDRGAFFGSIQETLSHLLWGDQIWMSRFAGTSKPVAGSIQDSRHMVPDWLGLCAERKAFDQVILDWSAEVSDDFLKGELSWFSGALNQDVSRRTAALVVHMFNHQTHHRGQVNTMITQAGQMLDDTDLFVLEERYKPS
ncbi:MAG: DinB family protein [Rhizobiaceae bacterium]|nr:DinB family protein [Rhizobiaceae bacterium]